MKVLVTVAMSNTKALAEHLITAMLPEVLDNICKIHLFRAYPESRTEWRDELEDKFLFKMSDVASNVKTKRGHLSKDVLIKIWLDEMAEKKVARHLFQLQRALKYKSLVKSGTNLAELTRRLRGLAPAFAKWIVEDDLNSVQRLSKELVEVATRSFD